MCADEGEPSLIFSSSVGWRREDGGGMKGGCSGAVAGERGLLGLVGEMEVLQSRCEDKTYILIL